MKRILYLCVCLNVIVSCKSKSIRSNSITIGDTDNMLVIEHNKTFNGIYVGHNEINTRSVNFDINGDGDNDFIIKSRVDTVIYPTANTPNFNYSVSISSLGSFDIIMTKNYFNVEELPSTDTIIAPSSVPQNYYHELRSSCSELINGNNGITTLYTGVFESSDVLVKDNELYSGSDLLIFHSNYSTFSSYDGSSYSYGKETRFDYSCASSEKNKILYLGVKSGVGSKEYIGWIELEITENNTVHVIRTAIQE